MVKTTGGIAHYVNEAISAFKLAQKLGVSESVIVNNRRDNRMVKSRYKILQIKSAVSRHHAFPIKFNN